MSSRLIQEGLKALLEDIGPKTSKQSIRPYMKNAVRGLREALAGSGPFDSRNIPNLVPSVGNKRYSPQFFNQRVRDFDDDFIGPNKKKSVVPYSMTDTAPIRHGDVGLEREKMNKINTRMYGIGKRSGSSITGGSLRTKIGKSFQRLRKN